MMGDWNARVGRLTPFDEGDAGVIGKHNLDAVNANGTMLKEVATSCKACIAGTFFKHKVWHKMTWMSPRFKIPRVIDHALIRQWSRRHIMDVRAEPNLSGYIHTDHVPCVITIRGNPRTKKTQQSRKWREQALPKKPGRLDVTTLTEAQFKRDKVGGEDNDVEKVAVMMESKVNQIKNSSDLRCIRAFAK